MTKRKKAPKKLAVKKKNIRDLGEEALSKAAGGTFYSMPTDNFPGAWCYNGKPPPPGPTGGHICQNK